MFGILCTVDNPVIMGPGFLSFILVTFLTECFKNAIVKLKAVGEPLKLQYSTKDLTIHGKNPYEELKSATSMLFTLCDLHDLTNKALGFLYMINFGLIIAFCTFFFYTASAIIFLDRFIMFRVLLALVSLFIGITYLYGMYALCSNGQDLEDVMCEARKQMQIARRTCVLDEDLEKDWSLIEFFLEKNNKLNYYGFFDVNNTTFLSTATIIFTYQIVMMQFRSTQ